MANQWLAAVTGAELPTTSTRPWWDALRRHLFALAVPFVLAVDALLILAVFRLTYAVRFHWRVLWPGLDTPPWTPYFLASLVMAGSWITVMALMGMYKDRRGAGHFDDVVILSCALAAGSFVGLAGVFFYREMTFSRLALVMATVLTWFAIFGWHYLLRNLQRSLLRRGWGALNTLIVGCNSLSETVGTRLYRHPEIGHRLLGFVPAPGERVEGDRWHFPAWSRHEGERAGSGPVLGELPDLARVVVANHVDEVILAVPGASLKELFGLMGQCSAAGWPVSFRIVPELTELITARLTIGELDGVPTLEIWDVPLRNGRNRFFKRATDMLLSGLAILILAPFLALLSWLVSLDRGPVLYDQERMGRDGRTFRLLKFRTMWVDAENQSGPVWTRRQDPRVTRIGAFLRRWSLDELPQLYNVLVGDMSLVGPRPERPYFVDQFRQNVPKYMDRHLVRSGLTGWAQINGLRGEEGSIEERTRYDIYYIENWSVLFDLKIMVRTLYEVAVHKAY